MRAKLLVSLILIPSWGHAETLCIRGPIFIENGVVVGGDIVKRGLRIECPADTNEVVQPGRYVPTSTEIKRIRDDQKAVAEKRSD